MLITSLQLLLIIKHVPLLVIKQATGRSRITVWRWREGKSYPERDDAKALITLFSDGGLDFNGCYTPTIEWGETGSMYSKCWFINTNIKASSMWAPPAECEDYAGWLNDRIQKSHAVEGEQKVYHGVAQFINILKLDLQQNETPIVAIGPFAKEAIEVLSEHLGDLPFSLYMIE